MLAHHLVISGYRQRRGYLAGCDCLVAHLDDYRRPGVRIESLPWDHDWRAEAAFIARHAQGQRPIVCLYPYSWGFGWGAMRLAHELDQHEIDVWGMRVCDGVYRHSYPWGNWRAFWPFSVVRLPANVQSGNVQLFVQNHSLLRGHRVADHEGEEITPTIVRRVRVSCPLGGSLWTPAMHDNMDESSEWIDASCGLAADVDRLVDELEATSF